MSRKWTEERKQQRRDKLKATNSEWKYVVFNKKDEIQYAFVGYLRIRLRRYKLPKTLMFSTIEYPFCTPHKRYERFNGWYMNKEKNLEGTK